MPATSPARHVLRQRNIERLSRDLSLLSTDTRANSHPSLEAANVTILGTPAAAVWRALQWPAATPGQVEHCDKQCCQPAADARPKSFTCVGHPAWWIYRAVTLVLFAGHNGQRMSWTMFANAPRVYAGIAVAIKVSATKLTRDRLQLSVLVVLTNYEISLASRTSLAIPASQLCLTQLEGRSPRKNKGRPSLFLEPVRATTASPERRIL